MKAYILCGLLLVCAATVLSRYCHHPDVSTCFNITCNAVGESVMCVHDLCTCGQDPNHLPCKQVLDCLSYEQCRKHIDHMHCANGLCDCH